MILQFTSFYIYIKYNKFKMSGEITKSGAKKVGPNLTVLIQAKIPVSPRCLANTQGHCSGFAGEQNQPPRLQAEVRGAVPTGSFWYRHFS